MVCEREREGERERERERDHLVFDWADRDHRIVVLL
jgi:hypothetical protein